MRVGGTTWILRCSYFLKLRLKWDVKEEKLWVNQLSAFIINCILAY